MRNLDVNREKLEALCRQYRVQRLAVFGSVLRGEDTPGSDIDLLVEFEGQRTPGWGMFRLEEELSYLFGQSVDLNTPGFISRYIRDQIVNSAQTIYVR